MLTSSPADARAWYANTVDDRSAWYYRLPEHLMSRLDQAVRAAEGQPVTAHAAVLEVEGAAELAPVRDALENGRGFAILQPVPRDRYSAAELPLVYWLVGQWLGRPMTQNVQGTLLYDVRDEGKDVRYGARFSVTNRETGFHTDNSFGDDVVDYVGLLCLQAARRGGENQVVSGYTVYHELRRRHPDVLAVLSQPFQFDRRGGLRPGDAPTVAFPVLQWDDAGLICRYLRYWIEAGHEKAGQPLTAAQQRALQILDEVLREPALRVEFALQPGDMFFANNRWLLHNRTEFEDFEEPACRRHYVRLWLERGP